MKTYLFIVLVALVSLCTEAKEYSPVTEQSLQNLLQEIGHIESQSALKLKPYFVTLQGQDYPMENLILKSLVFAMDLASEEDICPSCFESPKHRHTFKQNMRELKNELFKKRKISLQSINNLSQKGVGQLTEFTASYGVSGGVALATTWPVWTMVSEVIEHSIVGPFAVACMVSQVAYFTLFDQVFDFGRTVKSVALQKGLNLTERWQLLRWKRQYKKALRKKLKNLNFPLPDSPIQEELTEEAQVQAFLNLILDILAVKAESLREESFAQYIATKFQIGKLRKHVNLHQSSEIIWDQIWNLAQQQQSQRQCHLLFSEI